MPTIDTQELPQSPETPAPDPASDPDFKEVLETPSVKRGPGRPRTRFEPVELPNPRRFPLKPDEFFQYWYDCEQIDPNRLIVYVWRTFPIIDKKALDPDAVTNIGKMEKSPEPGGWRLAMLQRWGSGNYKLMLKDEGLKKPKAIAQTFITDLHDPDYPAWIESLDELVVDHPSNQAFIEGLKQKGVWPGERDMAAGEAVSALTGTIERLSNRLTEKSKEPGQPQPATAAPGSVELAKSTVDLAQSAFKQGVDLAKETTAAQIEAKVAAAKAEAAMVAAQTDRSGPTVDGLAMLERVAGILGNLRSGTMDPAQATQAAGGTAEVAKMVEGFMKRESELQATILGILRDEITSLKAERGQPPQAGAQAAIPQKDDFLQTLDKLVGMKEKLQDVFGGGEREEREERVPAWMSLAQSAMSGLPVIATSLLAMSYNMAVAKTGSGTPIPPGMPPNPEASALLPGGSAPNPTPAPDLGGAGGDSMRASYMVFLRQIERPLINHLNDPDKSGADFAAWVTDGYGEIGYQSARELGKDALLALLMSYPPIAQVIKQIPDRASVFIDEFMEADEGGDGDGGEDDGETGREGIGTVTNPIPVTPIDPARVKTKTKSKGR